METPRIADAARGLRHVFLRDLVLPASIGVRPRAAARPPRVGDYEGVADAVRAIVAAGHVMLVETLAERIAESCLADARVHLARVRVEKLDVFADAASAGVEIERRSA